MYNKNMYFKARLFIYYGTAQGTLDIWLRIEGGGRIRVMFVLCFLVLLFRNLLQSTKRKKLIASYL